MAWNKPGDGEDPNPWGGGKNNAGPPDLDKIFSQIFNKLRQLLRFKPVTTTGWQRPESQGYGVGLGMCALAIFVLWVLAGFYIVNPAEQAVVLRWGKFTAVQNPGLHWMARFIETKTLVDVQKVYSFSLTGEFLTKSSEQSDLPNQISISNKPSVTSNAGAIADGTDKSKNLVNVELNIQYRISDPRAYLYNVANPDSTIQDVTAGALSDAIGKMKLDDVLTVGREWLNSSVEDQLRQVLASYNTGLEIVAVTLRRVQAPDQVRAAFNDVNRADQDRATYIQQAQAYASKVVPLARGEAARISADATGYQQKVMLTAQADVAKFEALLNVYKVSPDVTRERMFMDAMQTILQNTSKVLVDLNASSNLLYLPIEKMIPSLKPSASFPMATSQEQTNTVEVQS